MTHTPPSGFSPETLKDLILGILDDNKAADIETINLQNQSPIADYMIIASGTSSRQVISLADKLKTHLNLTGFKQIKCEGTDQGNWVIVDAGDVIIHLFRPEVREFYNIEKMWNMPQTPKVELVSEYQTA